MASSALHACTYTRFKSQFHVAERKGLSECSFIVPISSAVFWHTMPEPILLLRIASCVPLFCSKYKNPSLHSTCRDHLRRLATHTSVGKENVPIKIPKGKVLERIIRMLSIKNS